jgi:tRNA1Val (adenine37-N6)-methyltransferase
MRKRPCWKIFSAPPPTPCAGRGRFALVQLPDRFMEAMELALRYRLQPKRLQWVHSAVDKPAWVFLAEFVKNGSHGLTVLPPLIMYGPDGSLTDQARRAMGETPEEEKDHA